MAVGQSLSLQALVDGIQHPVLVFDGDGALVLANDHARAFLGVDYALVSSAGWPAAEQLFVAYPQHPDQSLSAMQRQASEQRRASRFHIVRRGEPLACTVSIVEDAAGAPFTCVTVELNDWSALTELFDRFLAEVREDADAARGHADLILNSVRKPRANEGVEGLARRIGGFARLIQTHMHRMARLTSMMERMERIKTGQLAPAVARSMRRIVLDDFLEDFIEGLSEDRLLDPETEAHDYRQRLRVEGGSGLVVQADPTLLSAVLRDVLRNAIMYSMVATPITLTARELDSGVQIDLADEGYGIRSGESERVFAPFQRARQPQIIGEFGYGLSLYLCRHEVEAMGGRLWFESEEGVGTTFSLKLLAWQSSSGQQ
jgi:signal transduction histidine kinase